MSALLILLGSVMLQEAAPARVRPDALIGEWRLVKAEIAGAALDSKDLPKFTLVIDATGHWKDSDGGEATWKIGTANNLKTLDLVHRSRRDSGTSQLGIYDIADGRLFVALGELGGLPDSRPTSFSTKGTPWTAFVFEKPKRP